MDIIIKRRYTTHSDGSTHCYVTYQRPNGSRYGVQAY